jgi:hypothetical protein
MGEGVMPYPARILHHREGNSAGRRNIAGQDGPAKMILHVSASKIKYFLLQQAEI